MIERAFALAVLLVFVATFSWLFGWQRGFKNAIAMEARQGGDGETRPRPEDDSAGLQGIAQPQSVSGLSHTGVK